MPVRGRIRASNGRVRGDRFAQIRTRRQPISIGEDWRDTVRDRVGTATRPMGERFKVGSPDYKIKRIRTGAGETIVPDHFVPYGDTGIWYDGSNDVADPRDCDRYPTSPYCDKKFMQNLAEAALMGSLVYGSSINFSARGFCEQCIELRQRVFLNPMPPTIFCYRSRNKRCQPYEGLDESPLSDWVRDDPLIRRPITGVSTKPCTYVAQAYEPYWAKDGLQWSALKNGDGSVDAMAFMDQVGDRWHTWLVAAAFVGIPIAWERRLLPASGLTAKRWVLTLIYLDEKGEEHGVRMGTSPYEADWLTEYKTPNGEPYTKEVKGFEILETYDPPIAVGWTFGLSLSQARVKYPAPRPAWLRPAIQKELNYLRDTMQDDDTYPSCGDTPTPPQQPYYNGDDDVSCDCNETNDLLRLIAKRLGVDSYPMTVPVNIVDVPDPSQGLANFLSGKASFAEARSGRKKIESLTEFQAWFFEQMDALIGEFPIEIEVDDIDPTTKGEQKQTIKIPNLAEGLADLFAFGLKGSINGDMHTSFLMRLAAETIASKNATLVTHDLALANAEFLGYRMKQVAKQYEYSFNPADLDSIEGILSNAKFYVTSWENDNKETLTQYLKNLMFAAGLIKAVFFRSGEQIEDSVDQIKDLFDPNSDQNKQKDSQWQQFLNRVNAPNSSFNQESDTKPRIRDTNFFDGTPDKFTNDA